MSTCTRMTLLLLSFFPIPVDTVRNFPHFGLIFVDK